MLDSLCKSDIIKQEDWFLLLPVKYKYIKYTDLKDGSVNLRDIVYINEMIKIQNRIDDYYRQIEEVEFRTNNIKGI